MGNITISNFSKRYFKINIKSHTIILFLCTFMKTMRAIKAYIVQYFKNQRCGFFFKSLFQTFSGETICTCSCIYCKSDERPFRFSRFMRASIIIYLAKKSPRSRTFKIKPSCSPRPVLNRNIIRTPRGAATKPLNSSPSHPVVVDARTRWYIVVYDVWLIGSGTRNVACLP